MDMGTILQRRREEFSKAPWYWYAKGQPETAKAVELYNRFLSVRKDYKAAAVLLECKPEEVEETVERLFF